MKLRVFVHIQRGFCVFSQALRLEGSNGGDKQDIQTTGGGVELVTCAYLGPNYGKNKTHITCSPHVHSVSRI